MRLRYVLPALLMALSFPVHAQEEDEDWPRLVTFENGVRLTLHQPQVEAWRDFKSLEARLAATLELPDREALGTVRLRMQTQVDIPRQMAMVSAPEVIEVSFPALDDAQLTRAKEWVRRGTAVGAGEMQLADLIAAAQPGEAEVREVVVLNTPPNLLISRQPAILVMFDGAPVFEPIEGTDLELAMNSPSLLFRHRKTNWHYMLGWDAWLKTRDLEKGRWVAAGQLPSAFLKLPDGPLWLALRKLIPGRKLEAHDVPKVYVATEPTELIVTFGEATFQPVPDTSLTYVDNTESDVFLNAKDGMYYTLLSGRWFRTRGQGALEFCTDSLPDDFGKIPPEHPAGRVLASVPGTDEAADALSGHRLPHEATVKRGSIPLKVSYLGAPRFEAIRGTAVEAATNTDFDVFKADGKFYCCSDGLWFLAASAQGPYALCDSVPDAIYAIPPEHAAFNDTFVKVASATTDAITYSYTPGYLGSYVSGGIVVWGTGHRRTWSKEFWRHAWLNRKYWIERWDKAELHQWHRHLTYGQGRWFDQLGGVFRVSYDAMSHAKVRAHRGEAYRTWRGEAALPAARRKMPEPEPKKKPKPTVRVPKSRADLYAGADGKVYKREHGSWYRNDNDKWVHLSRKPALAKDEKKKKARQARLDDSYEARRRAKESRRYSRRRGRRGMAYYARRGWGYRGGVRAVTLPRGGGGGAWGGIGW
jgi:hypothetical protein